MISQKTLLTNLFFQLSYPFTSNLIEQPRTMMVFLKSHQILRSVIQPITINMVNNPPIRKIFTVHLFPNKDMFCNIMVSPISSRMRWNQYHFITCARVWLMCNIKPIFHGLTKPIMSIPGRKFISTILAIFRCSLLRMPTIRASIFNVFVTFRAMPTTFMLYFSRFPFIPTIYTFHTYTPYLYYITFNYWRGISLSHIIPLSRGGKTCKGNCLLECYVCHEIYEKHPERRDDKAVELVLTEWLKELNDKNQG